LRPSWKLAAVRTLELSFFAKKWEHGAEFARPISARCAEEREGRQTVCGGNDGRDPKRGNSSKPSLRHNRKMAATRPLVSGVAHEVKQSVIAIIWLHRSSLWRIPSCRNLPGSKLGVILHEAERTRLNRPKYVGGSPGKCPRSASPCKVNVVLRKTLKLRSYGLSNRNVEIV